MGTVLLGPTPSVRAEQNEDIGPHESAILAVFRVDRTRPGCLKGASTRFER